MIISSKMPALRFTTPSFLRGSDYCGVFHPPKGLRINSFTKSYLYQMDRPFVKNDIPIMTLKYVENQRLSLPNGKRARID